MCARLVVHVTPKSARNEIAGWRDSELRVRVTAPPEDGKANEAACKVLARALAVSKSRVNVVRGHSSRHKQVEVTGVDASEMEAIWGSAERE